MAERLTMQEVIEHYERAVIQAEMLRFTDTKQYMEHKQVREWLKELQYYKDLEERCLERVGLDFENMVGEFMHYYESQKQGRLEELPCKIGDTVYGIRRWHDMNVVKAGTVSEMFYTQNGKLMIVIKNVCRGHWGEKIFATLGEAEAALKGAEHATRHTDI